MGTGSRPGTCPRAGLLWACETGGEQMSLEGIGWRPLFLRAPSSRPASAWSGLHMPPPPGGFSVKQRCGQDHGWLVTLCPLAQGNLTTPPIGPVIERNPARVCSVLHIFPVKFICSGDLERESVGYVSFWLIFKSPLRIHSFCALGDLRAWPYRAH